VMTCWWCWAPGVPTTLAKTGRAAPDDGDEGNVLRTAVAATPTLGRRVLLGIVTGVLLKLINLLLTITSLGAVEVGGLVELGVGGLIKNV